MHQISRKTGARKKPTPGMLLATLIVAGAMHAQASNILFVGSANPLTGADANLSAILTGMGHIVTPKAATASATADTAGKHLVIISASINSGDVNTKFLNVNKPVVVLENALFDDMKMTGITSGTNFGSVTGVTQIALQDAAHQMAAGLTGTVTVYNAAETMAFGQTGTGAQNVASLTTDANRRVVFGYPSGAVMVGMNAPARRVGFFLETNSGSAANLHANGIALFKAAVSWAMSQTPPVITSSLTATTTAGTAFSYSITASGTTPITYGATGLPAGLSLSGAVISGTPAVSGTTSVTLTANNITGAPNSKTLVVSQSPNITSSLTASGMVGTTFNYMVTATGSTPITYSATPMPLGLTFTPGTATISGTPSTSGTTNVTLTATGVGTPSTKTLAISIGSTPVPATITTQPVGVSVVVGQSATLTVVASGSPAPIYQWQREYADIPGATSASYTVSSATAAHAGAYRVKVTNTGAPNLYSSTVSFNVVAASNSITYPGPISGDLTATTLSVTAGTPNSSNLTGSSAIVTGGNSHSGHMVGAKVRAVVGSSHSGNVVGMEVSSVAGATQSGRVTGLDINTSSGGFPLGGGEMTGLNVTVDNPGTGKAYGAQFNGGSILVQPNDGGSQALIRETSEIKNGEVVTSQVNNYSSKLTEARLSSLGFNYKISSTSSGGAILSETKINEEGIETTGDLRFDGSGSGGVDLLLQYRPFDVQNNSSLTFGQESAAAWAFKIHSGQIDPMLPYTEFNRKLVLTGPVEDGFEAEATLTHFHGLTLTKMKEGPTGLPEEVYQSFHNAGTLSLYSSLEGPTGNEVTQTFATPGHSQMLYNADGEQNEMEVSTDGWRHTTSVGGMVTSNTLVNIAGLETTARVKANNMEAEFIVVENLSVGGEVVTNKWRIPVPDYVFEKGYKRRSLEDVERFVSEKKHLPDIPSASDMERNGLPMGEMSLRLLKSVEELTLHVIDLNKELKTQRVRNDSMANEIKGLKRTGKGR